MTERLNGLLEQILGIPDPEEFMARAALSIVKAQARLLAMIPVGDGTLQQKQDLLAKSLENIEKVAQMTAVDDETIRLLRVVYDLASAAVEGRPDAGQT